MPTKDYCTKLHVIKHYISYDVICIFRFVYAVLLASQFDTQLRKGLGAVAMLIAATV